MALKSELMAAGLTWQLAQMLGTDPSVNVVPGGTGQSTATPLGGSSVAILTTAATGGALLPPASGAGITAIFNNSGNVQNIYANGNDTTNANAVGVAFSLTNGKSVICVPAGNKWILNMSA